jgi:hypothetical protein
LKPEKKETHASFQQQTGRNAVDRNECRVARSSGSRSLSAFGNAE